MSRRLWPGLLLLALFLTPALSRGERQTSTVHYVAADAVYIRAGAEQGLTPGDTLQVLREGQPQATLRVLFVAASNASCERIEGGEVRVGDAVLFDAPRPDPSRQAPEPAAAEAAAQPPPAPASPGATSPQEKSAPRRQPRLVGRVALQYQLQLDNGATGYNVHEPALLLRSELRDIFAPGVVLRVRGRARRFVRERGSDARREQSWNNRIYQVSLAYQPEGGAYRFEAGRMRSSRLAAMGGLDGLLAEGRIPAGLWLGGFAGTRPDPTTARPDPERTQAGLFLTGESRLRADQWLSATLALAGRYRTGQIDREFLFEQISYRQGRRFSLFQSAELALHRQWQREAQGSSMSLSNLLLSLRYAPSEAVALTASYDNRSLLRDAVTRSTPDSLFDDALRQGFRAGLQLRLPAQIRGWLRGGLRSRQGDPELTRTLSAGLSRADLFGSGVLVQLRANAFSNRYSEGVQPGLLLSRQLLNSLYSDLMLGASRYRLDSLQQPIDYLWGKLGATWSLNPELYLSGYAELYRGDNMKTNRLFVEAGYRF